MVAAEAGSEDGRFQLDDYLKGRTCMGAFEVTLHRFVAGIVGRRLYKKRLWARPTTDSKLYTASDEAFMLLVLENGWDRWVDIHERKSENEANTGSRKWRYLSDQPMLYTAGGIRYKEDSCDVKGSNGWSARGIERYNTLFRQVKADRARHPKAFTDWVDSVFAESGGLKTGITGKVAKCNREATAIDSELFSALGVTTDDCSGSAAFSGGPWNHDPVCSTSDDSDDSDSELSSANYLGKK